MVWTAYVGGFPVTLESQEFVFEMPKFFVDYGNKLFIAKPGIIDFDVKIDLYSDGKEHWLADPTAMGFTFPIRSVGGDPIGGSIFAGDLYFLRDGWKIRPQESDHTLSVTGNLFLDIGEVGEIFIPTVGDFTALVNMRNSNLVLTVSSGLGGVADWTDSEKLQIRHRLGIDGSSSVPIAIPSLSRPGDSMALINNAITGSVIAPSARTYQMKVWMTDDNIGIIDRYIAVFYKDSEPVVSGVTSPTIQVIAAEDGTDTIAATAMTQIGATGLFKYEETVDRLADGQTYIIKVTATIDSATRTWFQPMSRDR